MKITLIIKKIQMVKKMWMMKIKKIIRLKFKKIYKNKKLIIIFDTIFKCAIINYFR